MASEWIKWTKGLHCKKEVLGIAEALGVPPVHAAGLCMVFWEWLDDNVSEKDVDEDGNAHVTLGPLQLQFLDRLVMADGFAAALAAVGWLQPRNGSLVVPNFTRHNGQTGKTRAITAERVARHRTRRQECNASVTLAPLQKRYQKRKEKNREENLIPSASAEGSSEANGVRSEPPPTGPPEKPTEPTASKRPSLDEDAFAVWWANYPRKVGKQAARRAYIQARQRITQETGCTPAEARRRLLEAVQRFARTPKAAGPYCPHAATWLNQGRYDDDPAEWRRPDHGRNAPTRIRRAGRYDQPQLLSAGSAPEAAASGPPLPPPFTFRTAVGADSEGGAGGDH